MPQRLPKPSLAVWHKSSRGAPKTTRPSSPHLRTRNLRSAFRFKLTKALAQPDARDVTAAYRSGGRLINWNGCSYLAPTIILCNSSEHPLANREYLFPFASIIEIGQNQIPEALGKSLVVTAITRDSKLIERLIASPLVDRLNLGPIPTNQVAWDQPHEGNLFEHLFSRRAFQSPIEAA